MEIELWKEFDIVGRTLVRRLGSVASSATTLPCDLGETTVTPRCSAVSFVKVRWTQCFLSFL